MTLLVQSGRTAIAQALSEQPLHLAWGIGDGAWATPPAEDAAATALISEVGRRQIVDVGYVVPDVAGLIVLASGSFTLSGTPTKYLYLKTVFDFADAQSSVIREIAVFSGSTMVGGLPGGQQYFVPAEVATPGRMVSLQHLVPIYRSPAIRENFEIVIQF